MPRRWRWIRPFPWLSLLALASAWKIEVFLDEKELEEVDAGVRQQANVLGLHNDGMRH